MTGLISRSFPDYGATSTWSLSRTQRTVANWITDHMGTASIGSNPPPLIMITRCKTRPHARATQETHIAQFSLVLPQAVQATQSLCCRWPCYRQSSHKIF